MTTAASGPATRVQPSAFGCITVPFLLVALVALGWGARNQWNNGALMRSGEVVDGRVIELRHEPRNTSASTRKGSTVAPVVTFSTRAGQARQMTGSVNRSPAPWRVGDVVKVVYDPVRPERVDIQSELDSWMLWFAIWCLVGAIPLAIALAPVVLFLRQGPADPPAG
jgi:hypothetical protein